MQYVPRPLVTTKDEALQHLALIDEKIETGAGINWAITERGNDRMIGIIGLFRIIPEHFRAEIGYMLLPDFHGKGYISEAIYSTLEYGFDALQLHSVEAVIDPDNAASARVLEKNGFLREAHLRENEYYQGRFLDTVIYGFLALDFQQKRPR